MTVVPHPAPLHVGGWLEDLGDPAAPAVHVPEGDVVRTLTRADLAREVHRVAATLAGERRLVLVRMTNRLPSLVAYLAAHAAGHVVLLAPDTVAADALADAWDPDVDVAGDGAVTVHRSAARVPLHPDLALLMSTSGSTGSPRLVRLSTENLRSNAAAIAEYLAIRPTDRAVTSLPLHYCYGLSVLHSHLLAGASVVLTDASVADPGFGRLLHRARVTTLAGVPHTFDLLDRAGFADTTFPHLRTVTQAGGRLDPARVLALAELGRRRGFDLFVMYGQTEATARMTYLPPDLALTHPGSVGVAVPGGQVEVVDGEVVYSGPNVMLGYADRAADLALGRTVTALRTGDLGRLTPEGLLEITGRRSRVAKVLGQRVDLDHVERALRGAGHDVRVVDAGDRLGVVAAGRVPDRLAASAAATAAVPTHRVLLRTLADLALDDWPLLPSGKVDHRALAARLVPGGVGCPGGRPGSHVGTRPVGAGSADRVEGSLRTRYATVLGRPVSDADSFTTLGGDSLSYVEVSLHVEEVLGHLPADWHLTPVGDLERAARRPAGPPAAGPHGSPAAGPARRPWWQRLAATRAVETTVVLRALAILLVVGTHAEVFTLQGTAHALLVLVGLNLARFRLGDEPRRDRVRGLLRALRRVVAPTLVVVGTAHLLTGQYAWSTLALTNWVFGQARLGPDWRFWFVEAVVVGLVLVVAVVATPWGDRLERRHPFALPLGLSALGALWWQGVAFPPGLPHMQGSALVVLWLFCLGWAAGRARSTGQRLLVTVVALPTVGTFSGNPRRDLLTLAVVLLALWVPTVRVPRVVVPAAGVLAAASLHVYVVHWQVLQELRPTPWLAFVASTAAGVAYWWVWTRSPRLARAAARVIRARAGRHGTGVIRPPRRRPATPAPAPPARRRGLAARG